MKTIDVHTHGIGGYDTRTSNENHILKIAEILGSQGVSEIIPTIYPSSIKEMRKNMTTIKKAMEKQKEISNPPSPPFSKGGMRRFKKVGRGGITNKSLEDDDYSNRLSTSDSQPSTILGLHLEGPFLNSSRCGALDAKTFIEPTEKSLRKLIEGFEDVVKIITIAPELKGALQLIKKISDRGIIVSMGHSDATFSEAEAGFHAGARGITHIFNAMRSFHHREPGIAGFGLIHKDIYIEVIADPFHLHPKTLELIFKTKNPEKIIVVSDSIKETPSTIPLQSRDGVQGRGRGITDAHGKLRGGSMTIAESSQRLIRMGFEERIIMNCITRNPAKYLSV